MSLYMGALPSLQNVCAQRNNADSLLMVARQAANSGNREEALRACQTVVKNHPDYWDARLLLARIYLWNKEYDLARPHIKAVMDTNPNYFDAWDAQTDLSLWSADYAACLNECEQGLSLFHSNKQLLLKKAQAYNGLQKPELANETLDLLLAVDPQNEAALKMQKSLRDRLRKNRLSISYSYDYYQNRVLEPWRMLYLQYSRKIPAGTLVGRFNYAKRFGIDGVQGEADAYLKISNWNYGYLNVGYSSQSIFPRFRFGGEFYQKLPSAFEASLGVRYLNYRTSDVVLYTAYLGKYMSNWWLSGRTYFKLERNTSVTALLQARYYTATRDDYWGVRLNYGISPDERTNALSTVAVARLKSSGVRLEYSKQIYSRFVVNGAVMYNNTEWTANRYRNVFSGELILSYQF
ncbi:MAG: yaiO [Bacteroidetes bacterium]|nr:yaiO [Bacteroidota bacterium]